MYVRWLQSSSVHRNKAIRSTATKQIVKVCARYQQRSALYKKQLCNGSKSCASEAKEKLTKVSETGAEHSQERSCRAGQGSTFNTHDC